MIRVCSLMIAMLPAALFTVQGQEQPIGVPVAPLGNGPFFFDTAEQHKIRVTVLTKGLVHPWSLAFLPDGNILVKNKGERRSDGYRLAS